MIKRMLAVLFLILAVCSSQAVVLQRITSPGVFYVDNKSSAGILNNYAAYTVSNDTITTLPSVYVTLTNIVATNRIQLAGIETGVRNLGALAPGQAKIAAFYLHGPSLTGPPDLTGLTNEVHTIEVWGGQPGSSSILVSNNYSYTNILYVLESGANKVTIITNLNPYAVLGSIVPLVIGGETGTIGSPERGAFSPGVFDSWRPDAYQLESCLMSFSLNPSYSNLLYFSANTPGFTNFANNTYTNTYYFRARRVTGTNVPVSPFGFIQSGSQIKHTSLVSISGLSNNVIFAITNAVILNHVVTPPSFIGPTGVVTFFITITNSSLIDINLDQLKDILPGNSGEVSFVPNSAMYNSVSITNPSVSGQTLTWNQPLFIGMQSNSVLSFQASVNVASGTFTNRVNGVIGAEQIDTTLDTTDNSPSISVFTVIPVAATADVAISKTGPAGGVKGSTFDYTIFITNAGPSSATSLTITDALPAGLEFVSASPTATTNGSQVIWDLGTLAAFSSTNLTLTVSPMARVAYTNIATGGSTAIDPNPTNNTSEPAVTQITNTAPVALADSAVTVEDVAVTIDPLVNDYDVDGDGLTIVGAVSTNGSVVVLGGTNLVYTPATNFHGTNVMSYEISDGNGGSATGLVAVVVLPVNDAPVAQPDNASTLEDTSVLIDVLGNDFDVDEDGLTIVGAVSTNGSVVVLGGTNLLFTPDTNFTGSVQFSYIVSDGLGGSATGLVSVVVSGSADVSVTKSGPALSFAGSDLAYTIVASNAGPSAATGVLVSDILPAGFTLVSIAPTNGSLVGNTLSWSGITLLEKETRNFTVTLSSTNTGTFTNFASAQNSSDPDPNSDNDDAYFVTTLAPAADISVTKTGIGSVLAGSNFTYTVVVSNAGPSAASGVVVTDTLPAGVTFIGATGGGVFTNGSQVLWNLSGLSVGQSGSFELTVRGVTAGSQTNIVNAGAVEYDPNPNNNNGSLTSSRVVTTVLKAADVAIFLSGPNNATRGVAYTNIIVVTNMGPYDATNVLVSELLPTNLTLINATGGGSASNGVITWPAIPVLANGASQTFIVVTMANNVGLVTVIAAATATTPDPDLSNNDGTAVASQLNVQIDPPLVGIGLSGGITFNRQTGLYEQRVVVTNLGSVTFAAFQLYSTVVSNYAAPYTIVLINAAGTNNGKAFVQYNAPLNPGGSVMLVLEYYDPLRAAFTTLLEAEPVPPLSLGTSTNGSLVIDRIFTDERPAFGDRIVLEFASEPGAVYTVIYSDDAGATWLVATPSLTAIANRSQWYDDGPPKTISAPMSVPARIYRVIRAP